LRPAVLAPSMACSSGDCEHLQFLWRLCSQLLLCAVRSSAATSNPDPPLLCFIASTCSGESKDTIFETLSFPVSFWTRKIKLAWNVQAMCDANRDLHRRRARTTSWSSHLATLHSCEATICASPRDEHASPAGCPGPKPRVAHTHCYGSP
jgi:hypothetical protein